eukprot:CAMPEP_0168451980 /NCGR_PEP_ID=MMETSP0228-20121227/48912_1 /TAXON_ID=133427 /ORGANISM="Protoceratium reticulatum, Strain CCCM 535 (=CCMP 1889)" /LENGTH=60 /DNA_ID=CAMNT_0008466607 /DNA_START=149 /DNA_END=327 /DNA_ORIENTATION=+
MPTGRAAGSAAAAAAAVALAVTVGSVPQWQTPSERPQHPSDVATDASAKPAAKAHTLEPG